MSTNPLALAIAKLEGFGAGSNIPTTANNPGSLEIGDIGYGTMSAQGGQQITVFPSAASGWDALQHQLDKITGGTSKVYSPDTTLGDFGTVYSGGNSAYGQNLANALGVPASTPISQAADAAQPGSMEKLLQYANDAGIGDYNPSNNSVMGANATTGSFSLVDLYSNRFILLILGVLLFAAGLFAFKQTQTVIQTGTKAAKKAAELGVI